MLLALIPPLWYLTMNPLLERVLANKPPLSQPQPMDTKVWLFFISFNIMLTWFVLK